MPLEAGRITEQFSRTARRFCSLIDAVGSADVNTFLREVHLTVADLYAVAVALPLVAPENDEAVKGAMTEDDWDRLYQSLTAFLGDVDDYWEVFDPYHLEDPVPGSLADDLADIYQDVRRGLDVIERGGPVNEALWVWRFTSGRTGATTP